VSPFRLLPWKKEPKKEIKKEEKTLLNVESSMHSVDHLYNDTCGRLVVASRIHITINQVKMFPTIKVDSIQWPPLQLLLQAVFRM